MCLLRRTSNPAVEDVDSDDQSKSKKPVYECGKVVQRGKDIPNGTSLADYVDKFGHFDA